MVLFPAPSGLKRCLKCGGEFPLEQFPFQNKRTGRLHARCKPCWNEYQRAKQRNPKVVAARKAVYDTDGWRAQKERELQKNYGMSLVEYERMFDVQGGRCALCGQPPKKHANAERASLHVDHDHETGRVRRLLCGLCNRGIGCFHDDPERLRRAADYVASFKVAANTDRET